MGARETENLDSRTSHATGALIHLDHLRTICAPARKLVGKQSLWPAIKANAYGHGADIVGRHLVLFGYNRLCVAHVAEAIDLLETGVRNMFLVLSASAKTVHLWWRMTVSLEPIFTPEMVQALAHAAARAGKPASCSAPQGGYRYGTYRYWPDEVPVFLARCGDFPTVVVWG